MFGLLLPDFHLVKVDRSIPARLQSSLIERPEPLALSSIPAIWFSMLIATHNMGNISHCKEESFAYPRYDNFPNVEGMASNEEKLKHIQEMMRLTGLSASALATKAKLDHTTVTKFVKNWNKINYKMSETSLDKLSQVAGFSNYFAFQKAFEDKGGTSEIYLHGHITNMSGQRLGWICPNCGTPYAPHIESCKPCATTNLPATPPIKKQKEKLP